MQLGLVTVAVFASIALYRETVFNISAEFTHPILSGSKHAEVANKPVTLSLYYDKF